MAKLCFKVVVNWWAAVKFTGSVGNSPVCRCWMREFDGIRESRLEIYAGIGLRCCLTKWVDSPTIAVLTEVLTLAE